MRRLALATSLVVVLAACTDNGEPPPAPPSGTSTGCPPTELQVTQTSDDRSIRFGGDAVAVDVDGVRWVIHVTDEPPEDDSVPLDQLLDEDPLVSLHLTVFRDRLRSAPLAIGEVVEAGDGEGRRLGVTLTSGAVHLGPEAAAGGSFRVTALEGNVLCGTVDYQGPAMVIEGEVEARIVVG